MRNACLSLLVLAMWFVATRAAAADPGLGPGMKGRLGPPLGTIVTVEGVAAGDDYRRLREDVGYTLLRIERVNGQVLPNEIVYRFEAHSLAKLEAPTPGARFKLVGYETGGFTGIPEDAFRYIPRVATTGFAFTTRFLVLQSE